MRYNIIFVFVVFCGLLGPNAKANAASDYDGEETPCDINFLIQGTPTFELCYEDRKNFNMSFILDNLSSDTLNDVNFSWFVAADLHGDFSIVDPLNPNSQRVISMPELSFPSEGTYTIKIYADGLCESTVTQTDSMNITVNVRSEFLVDEIFDTTICKSDVLTLTSPGIYEAYEWSTGNTTNSITVQKSGEYKVTITDIIGCTTVDSMTLDLYGLSQPLVGDDTVLCDGVILTAGTGPGFESYLWSNGSTTSTIDIASSGSYTLMVVDTLGCIYSDTIDVTYATVPTPGAPDVVDICQGETATVNASPIYSSYVWNTGDTTTQITVSNPGTYYLTVTGSSGCIGLDTIMVNVHQLPSVVFNDSVMCNNESYVLDAGQWFPKINWSTGDTVQDLLVDQPGIYSVTVEDLNGCKMADTIKVSNIDVAVNLGPDEEICEGSPFFLLPQGSFDSYEWIDGSTGPSFQVTASGTYNVTVTSSVCSATDEVTITVTPEPEADFNYNIISPQVEFTNLSNQSNNLMWYFGDGDSSTVENPVHDYKSAGLYSVTLEVTNICGTDVYGLDLNIYPQGRHSIELNSNLKVFPTLTESNINFSISGVYTPTIEYVVIDVTGKTLQSKVVTYNGDGFQYSLNVGAYASGTYFLKILDANKEYVAVQPFVRK